MYDFVTGPLLILSFIIFVVGCCARIILYIKGLNWQADRVAYSQYPYYGLKGALRSIIFTLIPFGNKSWRVKPGFCILFFVFHIGLIFTPIFLEAHNELLRNNFGFSLFTLPECISDILTIIVIISGIILILRRIALAEVRIITTLYDYIMILIAILPFITGFLAYHLFPDYKVWLIMHIISGEIMLIAIPFTKLSHFVLFFMSRAQIGMDFGIKRGGMKGKNLPW